MGKCYENSHLLIPSDSNPIVDVSVVSLSEEFDIFAEKPVQTSFVETTEVTYKPIAPVVQNELDFVIPANSEKYIDLDIKFYL